MGSDDLDRLIQDVRTGIHKEAKFLEKIRDPKALLRSLKDLRSLIGNDEVKNSIAQQTSHLIREGGNRDNMLHTILYGPPGVGNTLIGTKLARIWHSLGYNSAIKKQRDVLGDILPSQGSEEFDSLASRTVLLILLMSSLGSFIEFLGRLGVPKGWRIAIFSGLVFMGIILGIYLSSVNSEPVTFVPPKVEKSPSEDGDEEEIEEAEELEGGDDIDFEQKVSDDETDDIPEEEPVCPLL